MGGCHGTFVGDVRRLNGLGGTAVSHAEFVQRVRGLQYRELTPDDYDLLSQLDEMIPRRNVVPASVVGNLPCISARDFDQQSCTICQGDFTPTERLAKLPCQHAFHQHCIGRWLTQHRNSCPLCAAVIEPLESSRDCGCSAIDAPGRRGGQCCSDRVADSYAKGAQVAVWASYMARPWLIEKKRRSFPCEQRFTRLVPRGVIS
eukprot:TRINITY_DN13130_c0_g1_i2.p1 TRINITY_DN13130_c0_g1~~TRINITY_DN13130_c0_g1_i2.p1  ORF type:complete len:228 (-),score=21.04 TRINITY_DN13130_c0_g1_i2:174-782(-)